MRLGNKVLPMAVSLAIVAAVTAVLWRIKLTVGGSHQYVYFYLFPVILIRVLFSDALAALCAAIASLLANYFLQDPLYSLYNADRLDYGDLIGFFLLSLLAIKCVFSDPLMSPGKKSPTGRSRAEP
jgi:K+-sensing histidine kinase KdpD